MSSNGRLHRENAARHNTKPNTRVGQDLLCLSPNTYELAAWEKYCQSHGITHEFTAPYSSVQNRLAEHAIRTTIDDVRTYFMILILVTPTGLKQQLTLLICTILFPLTDTLVFPQKHSQENNRMSHTFEVLVLSAGPKYLLLMETQSSILRVLSVDYSVMLWGVRTIKLLSFDLLGIL